MLEDQISKFREDRRLGRARAIDWKELEEEEIIRLCEELTPRFDPDLYRSLVNSIWPSRTGAGGKGLPS